MASTSFEISTAAAACLLVMGALFLTASHNLIFSIYLVAAFRKRIDHFKVAMNAALVANSVCFAMFFFPIDEACNRTGIVGNAYSHLFLICIDLLLMCRVYALAPRSTIDLILISILSTNRVAAAISDVILSTAQTDNSSGFATPRCVYTANIFTSWWYLASDFVCDLYATVRNVMIMRAAERSVKGTNIEVRFFGIYRNWNLLRSSIVLVLNVGVGAFTTLLYQSTDSAVYIIANSVQFLIYSYIMTHDMTIIKTVENYPIKSEPATKTLTSPTRNIAFAQGESGSNATVVVDVEQTVDGSDPITQVRASIGN